MPFGPYTDFQDCVLKNKDKSSPEGYCASLHKKITGEWPGQKKETLDLKKGAVTQIPIDILWKMRAIHAYPGDMSPKREPYTMQRIEDAMRKGQIEPIIVDQDDIAQGKITDGKHRLIIAKKLGMKTYPVILRNSISLKEDTFQKGDHVIFVPPSSTEKRLPKRHGVIVGQNSSHGTWLIQDDYGENPIEVYPQFIQKESVSPDQIKRVYDALECNCDYDQFKMGMGVEMEHNDVTGGDLFLTGKIVAAHLKELPDYYSRLAKMEEEKLKSKGENMNKLEALHSKFVTKKEAIPMHDLNEIANEEFDMDFDELTKEQQQKCIDIWHDIKRHIGKESVYDKNGKEIRIKQWVNAPKYGDGIVNQLTIGRDGVYVNVVFGGSEYKTFKSKELEVISDKQEGIASDEKIQVAKDALKTGNFGVYLRLVDQHINDPTLQNILKQFENKWLKGKKEASLQAGTGAQKITTTEFSPLQAPQRGSDTSQKNDELISKSVSNKKEASSGIRGFVSWAKKQGMSLNTAIKNAKTYDNFRNLDSKQLSDEITSVWNEKESANEAFVQAGTGAQKIAWDLFKKEFEDLTDEQKKMVLSVAKSPKLEKEYVDFKRKKSALNDSQNAIQMMKKANDLLFEPINELEKAIKIAEQIDNNIRSGKYDDMFQESFTVKEMADVSKLEKLHEKYVKESTTQKQLDRFLDGTMKTIEFMKSNVIDKMPYELDNTDVSHKIDDVHTELLRLVRLIKKERPTKDGKYIESAQDDMLKEIDTMAKAGKTFDQILSVCQVKYGDLFDDSTDVKNTIRQAISKNKLESLQERFVKKESKSIETSIQYKKYQIDIVKSQTSGLEDASFGYEIYYGMQLKKKDFGFENKNEAIDEAKFQINNRLESLQSEGVYDDISQKKFNKKYDDLTDSQKDQVIADHDHMSESKK